MFDQAMQSANAYVGEALANVVRSPRPADLAALQEALSVQANRAEDLAGRAGYIGDSLFGPRPEACGTGAAPSQPTMVATIERLAEALDRLQANLNRL